MSPDAGVTRHHATDPDCNSTHWRARTVLPYPAGATSIVTRRRLAASRRAVSRGRSMMWSRAGRAAVVVSTIVADSRRQPGRELSSIYLICAIARYVAQG